MLPNWASQKMQNNSPATFSFTYKGNHFTGTYKGLAAIKVDATGSLQKLAATAFSSLQKNGKDILHLDKEADIFIAVQNGIMQATIADESKSIKIYRHD